jgi:hypothetical protein
LAATFNNIRHIEMYGRCFLCLVDLQHMLGISDSKSFRQRFEKTLKYGGRLFVEIDDVVIYLGRSRMDNGRIEYVRRLLSDLERPSVIGQPPLWNEQPPLNTGQQTTDDREMSSNVGRRVATGLKSNRNEDASEIEALRQEVNLLWQAVGRLSAV